jgi:hypothetical protein
MRRLILAALVVSGCSGSPSGLPLPTHAPEPAEAGLDAPPPDPGPLVRTGPVNPGDDGGEDSQPAEATATPVPDAGTTMPQACTTTSPAEACWSTKCGYASIGCGAYVHCPDTAGCACDAIAQSHCLPTEVTISCIGLASLPAAVCRSVGQFYCCTIS